MADDELLHAAITGSVIGAFFEVYNEKRYGFLEHVYSLALEIELLERGHHVAREAGVPIFYKSHHLCDHKVDVLVDHCVIVEIKAGPVLPKTAISQLNNYLRATQLEVGLLLHFGPEPKVYRQTISNKNKHGRTDKLV